MENLIPLIIFAFCVIVAFFDIMFYVLMHKDLTSREKLLGAIPLYMYWILYKKHNK